MSFAIIMIVILHVNTPVVGLLLRSFFLGDEMVVIIHVFLICNLT